MRALVVDTDVFSFLFKNDSRAALYSPYITQGQLCLSFQTIAELRFWAMTRRWGEPRRRSLEKADFSLCGDPIRR
jgi:predicted nucleic acid-binding protein